MPLMPEGRTLYISQPLTTISTAYAQAGNWVAPQVFPVVNVARQGDLYWKYPQGDWKRTIASLRAPATESVGGGWNMTTDSYFANVYAVHKDVDDQTATNAAGGSFNLYADAANWVTEQLFLKRDKQWMSTYMKTSLWTGSTGIGGGSNGADITAGTATGSNQVIYWNRSGATPIEDIQTQVLGMAERTGYRPNTLVIGPAVYNALLQSAEIIDRIKYSERGIISEDLIRAVLNVDRLIVTWTTENTAPMGATDSIGFMNKKSALLVYAAPTPGLQTLSGGYTFAWSGLLGAGAMGTRIKRFRMEHLESDRIEGEMAFDMKVVAPDVGIYFSNVVE